MPPMETLVENARERRFFRPDVAAVRAEEAALLHDSAEEDEKNEWFELVSPVAPDHSQKLVEELQAKGWRVRPFTRLKRANLNNPDDEDALPDFTSDTYKVTPYADGETKGLAGEQLLISEIEIMVKPTLLPNTVDVLIQQHGVRVHYPDGRPPLEFALRDVLTNGRVTPDAGVDNATAGSEAPEAGTQTHILPSAQRIRLQGRDRWFVKNNDQEHKLEFFRYYSTAPALTGETADLFFYVFFRGARRQLGKVAS